jgi:hypothetical protein
VFPVRYGLDFYMLIRRNSVFKVLISRELQVFLVSCDIIFKFRSTTSVTGK